jgi:tripartite-type tricarboxylate transporter receptor subunit TctC
MTWRHLVKPGLPQPRRLGAAATLIAAVAVTQSIAPSAWADTYPDKPVHIVLGLAPGGMNDIVARLLADQLGRKIGQSVVVENRAGAGGTVAAGYVAKSTPDGYTLFVGAISNMAIAPNQYKALPYNPITDFAPITQLASSSNILVANPKSSYRTVEDVIAAGRKDASRAMYATAGLGTSPHMAGELFNLMAGIKLPNVPYKGDGPALTDVASGQVPLAFPALPAAITFVKSNLIRAIAVTSKARSPLLPNVPTIAESGVAGYDMSPWVGIFAPAKTPRKIIDLLNRELIAILNTAEIRQRFADLALEPAGDTPEEFERFLKSEIDKWGKVAQAAGITPQ